MTYEHLLRQVQLLWSTSQPLTIDISLDDLISMAAWPQATTANIDYGSLDVSIATIYGPVALNIIDNDI